MYGPCLEDRITIKALILKIGDIPDYIYESYVQELKACGACIDPELVLMTVPYAQSAFKTLKPDVSRIFVDFNTPSVPAVFGSSSSSQLSELFDIPRDLLDNDHIYQSHVDFSSRVTSTFNTTIDGKIDRNDITLGLQSPLTSLHHPHTRTWMVYCLAYAPNFPSLSELYQTYSKVVHQLSLSYNNFALTTPQSKISPMHIHGLPLVYRCLALHSRHDQIDPCHSDLFVIPHQQPHRIRFYLQTSVSNGVENLFMKASDISTALALTHNVHESTEVGGCVLNNSWVSTKIDIEEELEIARIREIEREKEIRQKSFFFRFRSRDTVIHKTVEEEVIYQEMRRLGLTKTPSFLECVCDTYQPFLHPYRANMHIAGVNLLFGANQSAYDNYSKALSLASAQNDYYSMYDCNIGLASSLMRSDIEQGWSSGGVDRITEFTRQQRKFLLRLKKMVELELDIVYGDMKVWLKKTVKQCVIEYCEAEQLREKENTNNNTNMLSNSSDNTKPVGTGVGDAVDATDKSSDNNNSQYSQSVVSSLVQQLLSEEYMKFLQPQQHIGDRVDDIDVDLDFATLHRQKNEGNTRIEKYTNIQDVMKNDKKFKVKKLVKKFKKTLKEDSCNKDQLESEMDISNNDVYDNSLHNEDISVDKNTPNLNHVCLTTANSHSNSDSHTIHTTTATTATTDVSINTLNSYDVGILSRRLFKQDPISPHISLDNSLLNSSATSPLHSSSFHSIPYYNSDDVNQNCSTFEHFGFSDNSAISSPHPICCHCYPYIDIIVDYILAQLELENTYGPTITTNTSYSSEVNTYNTNIHTNSDATNLNSASITYPNTQHTVSTELNSPSPSTPSQPSPSQPSPSSSQGNVSGLSRSADDDIDRSLYTESPKTITLDDFTNDNEDNFNGNTVRTEKTHPNTSIDIGNDSRTNSPHLSSAGDVFTSSISSFPVPSPQPLHQPHSHPYVDPNLPLQHPNRTLVQDLSSLSHSRRVTQLISSLVHYISNDIVLSLATYLTKLVHRLSIQHQHRYQNSNQPLNQPSKNDSNSGNSTDSDTSPNSTYTFNNPPFSNPFSNSPSNTDLHLDNEDDYSDITISPLYLLPPSSSSPTSTQPSYLYNSLSSPLFPPKFNTYVSGNISNNPITSATGSTANIASSVGSFSGPPQSLTSLLKLNYFKFISNNTNVNGGHVVPSKLSNLLAQTITLSGGIGSDGVGGVGVGVYYYVDPVNISLLTLISRLYDDSDLDPNMNNSLLSTGSVSTALDKLPSSEIKIQSDPISHSDSISHPPTPQSIQDQLRNTHLDSKFNSKTTKSAVGGIGVGRGAGGLTMTIVNVSTPLNTDSNSNTNASIDSNNLQPPIQNHRLSVSTHSRPSTPLPSSVNTGHTNSTTSSHSSVLTHSSLSPATPYHVINWGTHNPKIIDHLVEAISHSSKIPFHSSLYHVHAQMLLLHYLQKCGLKKQFNTRLIMVYEYVNQQLTLLIDKYCPSNSNSNSNPVSAIGNTSSAWTVTSDIYSASCYLLVVLIQNRFLRQCRNLVYLLLVLFNGLQAPFGKCKSNITKTNVRLQLSMSLSMSDRGRNYPGSDTSFPHSEANNSLSLGRAISHSQTRHPSVAMSPASPRVTAGRPLSYQRTSTSASNNYSHDHMTCFCLWPIITLFSLIYAKLHNVDNNMLSLKSLWGNILGIGGNAGGGVVKVMKMLRRQREMEKIRAQYQVTIESKKKHLLTVFGEDTLGDSVDSGDSIVPTSTSSVDTSLPYNIDECGGVGGGIGGVGMGVSVDGLGNCNFQLCYDYTSSITLLNTLLNACHNRQTLLLEHNQNTSLSNSSETTDRHSHQSLDNSHLILVSQASLLHLLWSMKRHGCSDVVITHLYDSLTCISPPSSSPPSSSSRTQTKSQTKSQTNSQTNSDVTIYPVPTPSLSTPVLASPLTAVAPLNNSIQPLAVENVNKDLPVPNPISPLTAHLLSSPLPVSNDHNSKSIFNPMSFPVPSFSAASSLSTTSSQYLKENGLIYVDISHPLLLPLLVSLSLQLSYSTSPVLLPSISYTNSYTHSNINSNSNINIGMLLDGLGITSHPTHISPLPATHSVSPLPPSLSPPSTTSIVSDSNVIITTITPSSLTPSLPLPYFPLSNQAISILSVVATAYKNTSKYVLSLHIASAVINTYGAVLDVYWCRWWWDHYREVLQEVSRLLNRAVISSVEEDKMMYDDRVGIDVSDIGVQVGNELTEMYGPGNHVYSDYYDKDHHPTTTTITLSDINANTNSKPDANAVPIAALPLTLSPSSSPTTPQPQHLQNPPQHQHIPPSPLMSLSSLPLSTVIVNDGDGSANESISGSVIDHLCDRLLIIDNQITQVNILSLLDVGYVNIKNQQVFIHHTSQSHSSDFLNDSKLGNKYSHLKQKLPKGAFNINNTVSLLSQCICNSNPDKTNDYNCGFCFNDEKQLLSVITHDYHSHDEDNMVDKSTKATKTKQGITSNNYLSKHVSCEDLSDHEHTVAPSLSRPLTRDFQDFLHSVGTSDHCSEESSQTQTHQLSTINQGKLSKNHTIHLGSLSSRDPVVNSLTSSTHADNSILSLDVDVTTDNQVSLNGVDPDSEDSSAFKEYFKHCEDINISDVSDNKIIDQTTIIDTQSPSEDTDSSRSKEPQMLNDKDEKSQDSIEVSDSIQILSDVVPDSGEHSGEHSEDGVGNVGDDGDSDGDGDDEVFGLDNDTLAFHNRIQVYDTKKKSGNPDMSLSNSTKDDIPISNNAPITTNPATTNPTVPSVTGTGKGRVYHTMKDIKNLKEQSKTNPMNSADSGLFPKNNTNIERLLRTKTGVDSQPRLNDEINSTKLSKNNNQTLKHFNQKTPSLGEGLGERLVIGSLNNLDNNSGLYNGLNNLENTGLYSGESMDFDGDDDGDDVFLYNPMDDDPGPDNNSNLNPSANPNSHPSTSLSHLPSHSLNTIDPEQLKWNRTLNALVPLDINLPPHLVHITRMLIWPNLDNLLLWAKYGYKQCIDSEEHSSPSKNTNFYNHHIEWLAVLRHYILQFDPNPLPSPTTIGKSDNTYDFSYLPLEMLLPLILPLSSSKLFKSLLIRNFGKKQNSSNLISAGLLTNVIVNNEKLHQFEWLLNLSSKIKLIITSYLTSHCVLNYSHPNTLSSSISRSLSTPRKHRGLKFLNKHHMLLNIDKFSLSMDSWARIIGATTVYLTDRVNVIDITFPLHNPLLIPLTIIPESVICARVNTRGRRYASLNSHSQSGVGVSGFTIPSFSLITLPLADLTVLDPPATHTLTPQSTAIINVKTNFNADLSEQDSDLQSPDSTSSSKSLSHDEDGVLYIVMYLRVLVQGILITLPVRGNEDKYCVKSNTHPSNTNSTHSKHLVRHKLNGQYKYTPLSVSPVPTPTTVPTSNSTPVHRHPLSILPLPLTILKYNSPVIYIKSLSTVKTTLSNVNRTDTNLKNNSVVSLSCSLIKNEDSSTHSHSQILNCLHTPFTINMKLHGLSSPPLPLSSDHSRSYNIHVFIKRNPHMTHPSTSTLASPNLSHLYSSDEVLLPSWPCNDLHSHSHSLSDSQLPTPISSTLPSLDSSSSFNCNCNHLYSSYLQHLQQLHAQQLKQHHIEQMTQTTRSRSRTHSLSTNSNPSTNVKPNTNTKMNPKSVIRINSRVRRHQLHHLGKSPEFDSTNSKRKETKDTVVAMGPAKLHIDLTPFNDNNSKHKFIGISGSGGIGSKNGKRKNESSNDNYVVNQGEGEEEENIDLPTPSSLSKTPILSAESTPALSSSPTPSTPMPFTQTSFPSTSTSSISLPLDSWLSLKPSLDYDIVYSNNHQSLNNSSTFVDSTQHDVDFTINLHPNAYIIDGLFNLENIDSPLNNKKALDTMLQNGFTLQVVVEYLVHTHTFKNSPVTREITSLASLTFPLQCFSSLSSSNAIDNQSNTDIHVSKSIPNGSFSLDNAVIVTNDLHSIDMSELDLP